MNLPSNPAPTPAPARPQQPQRDDPRRPQGFVEQQQGERFARLLREKSTRGGDAERCEHDPDAPETPPPEAVPIAAILRLAQKLTGERNEELPVVAPGGANGHGGPAAAEAAAEHAPRAGTEGDVSAARAAIEARLNTGAAPPLAARGAEASWTATLREPLGVAIEVRATRMSPDAAPGRAGWSLTIAAPAVDTSLLTRHAPRLSDRLKTRVIEHTHVRIERDEQEST